LTLRASGLPGCSDFTISSVGCWRQYSRVTRFEPASRVWSEWIRRRGGVTVRCYPGIVPCICLNPPNAQAEPPPEAQAERSEAEAGGGRLQCLVRRGPDCSDRPRCFLCLLDVPVPVRPSGPQRLPIEEGWASPRNDGPRSSSARPLSRR
jgi:hypothetical protein